MSSELAAQTADAQHADLQQEFDKLLARPMKPMGADDEPFATPEQFEHVQRVARAYAASALVPDSFRGKVADCAIVVALAWRHKADPLTFFQHIHVIHGRPGMDAQLCIALANNSGKLRGPITHELKRDRTGQTVECIARATLSDGGQQIETSITWSMVEAEGWSKKAGSKWLTLRDHMFKYRASVFLCREYIPETLLGIYTTDELQDIDDTESQPAPLQAGTKSFRNTFKAAPKQQQKTSEGAPPSSGTEDTPADESPFVDDQEPDKGVSATQTKPDAETAKDKPAPSREMSAGEKARAALVEMREAVKAQCIDRGLSWSQAELYCEATFQRKVAQCTKLQLQELKQTMETQPELFMDEGQ